MDRLTHLRQSLQAVKRLTDVCSVLVETPREHRASAMRDALAQVAPEVGGAWLPVASVNLRHHALQTVLPHEAAAISTNKHCPVILFLPILVPEQPERDHPRSRTGNVVGDLAAWVGETAAGWAEKAREPLLGRGHSAADELEPVPLCGSSNPTPGAALCAHEYAGAGSSTREHTAVHSTRPSAPGGLGGASAGACLGARDHQAREMITCARQLCDAMGAPVMSSATRETEDSAMRRDTDRETSSSANQSPRDTYLCSPDVSPRATEVSEDHASHLEDRTSLLAEQDADADGELSRAGTQRGQSSARGGADGGGAAVGGSGAPKVAFGGVEVGVGLGISPAEGASLSPSGPALPVVDQIRRDSLGADKEKDKAEMEPAEASLRVRQMFGELWEERDGRICAAYQRAKGSPPPGFAYRTLPCLVKTGDPLLQEQFAILLVRVFQDIFDSAKLPLPLHAYSVVATTPSGGMVQLVTDSNSIDSLKRNNPASTLSDLFASLFGAPSTKEHRRAIRNFCNSCAAWAVVCYFLQIKDRHNGNILLHANGHIVHIDFGFMLTNSPGGNMNFESAPFKLTSEYVQLMGGVRSLTFLRFRDLVIKVGGDLRCPGAQPSRPASRSPSPLTAPPAPCGRTQS